jgi:Arc/MetJ-type ribon-helix-helix transcriptional regulator
LRRLSAVISDQEHDRIQKLVRAGAAKSVAELVRLAVRDYTAKTGSIKLLNLRDVPPNEARKTVERYFKTHHGVVWPDEMAEELGLDYRVVLQVVRELQTEHKVEEASAREELIET